MSEELNEKQIVTKLLAFYSPKGGPGKTTCATQIACTLKYFGKTVALYDLDPQRTATWYFSRITDKFKPDFILHDFSKAPPKKCDFIILDCEPSDRFIPPIEFTIIAPTLASSLDMHSYRKIKELEQQGYNVIRVINQFSLVRSDDEKVKNELDPCVCISQNSAIRTAMNNSKTIWNSGEAGGKRAKHQFTFLLKQILNGEVEKLSIKEFNNIAITGKK